MWTLPEASEIARPNANVEESNMPVAAECGSKKVVRLSLLILLQAFRSTRLAYCSCFSIVAPTGQPPQVAIVIKFSGLWLIQCHAQNHIADTLFHYYLLPDPRKTRLQGYFTSSRYSS
jgi:hypothetical protein